MFYPGTGKDEYYFTDSRDESKKGDGKMCNFQSLEITSIITSKLGIFICAKYDGWTSYFDFRIRDGTIMGRTFRGAWQQLSAETARIIYEKYQQLLRDRDAPIVRN
jgi:hypothetical protein